jgi:hypothetical protein
MTTITLSRPLKISVATLAEHLSLFTFYDRVFTGYHFDDASKELRIKDSSERVLLRFSGFTAEGFMEISSAFATKELLFWRILTHHPALMTSRDFLLRYVRKMISC